MSVLFRFAPVLGRERQIVARLAVRVISGIRRRASQGVAEGCDGAPWLARRGDQWRGGRAEVRHACRNIKLR